MSDLLGREPDELAAALSTHDDYRVIRRYKQPTSYAEQAPDKERVKTGIYVDVETTGLDYQSDLIIELAMVKFEFTSDGQLYGFTGEYNQLNDPGRPIPAEITNITGITDEMVTGKHIDADDVKAFIADASIIVAHNAGFDRKFVEASFEGFSDKAWACSASQVPWREAGFESAKLEYLAYRQGFFYSGHRAVIDCLAGIHVLSYTLDSTGKPAFAAMLEEARKKAVRLWAANSPFESKDILKGRGYRWNSGDDGKLKAWYKDFDQKKLAEEQGFLFANVYGSKRQLPTETINAFNRFSARI